MTKVLSTLFAIFLSTCTAITQERKDTLHFKDRLQAVTKDNIFGSDDYFNWGPSILKDKDGTYHLFYSRWPKKYKYLCWLTHSEIAHAVSDSPAGPWKFKETVLGNGIKGNWDEISSFNPKIKYFGGKYYLYYCSTNFGDKEYTDADLIETAAVGYQHPYWKILRKNQRAGVAVSNSINGPWKRMEKTLIEPSGPIVTLTVNPAIDQGADGKYYLIIKGDKPGKKRTIRSQAIAISDKPTGPFTILPKPVIDYIDTEDMSMWYDKKRDYYYGVFHAHSFLGMVSSPNGIDWNKATEYTLTPKEIPMADGSTIKPDRMERPFVYTEDSEPKVFAFSIKKGNESFLIFRPIAPHYGILTLNKGCLNLTR